MGKLVQGKRTQWKANAKDQSQLPSKLASSGSFVHLLLLFGTGTRFASPTGSANVFNSKYHLQLGSSMCCWWRKGAYSYICSWKSLGIFTLWLFMSLILCDDLFSTSKACS
ncbi:hypothetical protein CFOL_v3_26402 [Cephalotus follicularis]|uniref:Uncharacterized protein n=1 Tax=Cephalotus follicularis TaxID=3775 RepID=A0A1Q3CS43_CEPFO|nr:hypothetical protein CFOL_v3_26402 [Cephalotus follicularis]